MGGTCHYSSTRWVLSSPPPFVTWRVTVEINWCFEYLTTCWLHPSCTTGTLGRSKSYRKSDHPARLFRHFAKPTRKSAALLSFLCHSFRTLRVNKTCMSTIFLLVFVFDSASHFCLWNTFCPGQRNASHGYFTTRHAPSAANVFPRSQCSQLERRTEETGWFVGDIFAVFQVRLLGQVVEPGSLVWVK